MFRLTVVEVLSTVRRGQGDAGIRQVRRRRLGLQDTPRSTSVPGATLSSRLKVAPVLVVGGGIPRRLSGVLATRLHGRVEVRWIQEPGIKLLGVVC